MLFDGLLELVGTLEKSRQARRQMHVVDDTAVHDLHVGADVIGAPRAGFHLGLEIVDSRSDRCDRLSKGLAVHGFPITASGMTETVALPRPMRHEFDAFKLDDMQELVATLARSSIPSRYFIGRSV